MKAMNLFFISFNVQLETAFSQIPVSCREPKFVSNPPPTPPAIINFSHFGWVPQFTIPHKLLESSGNACISNPIEAKIAKMHAFLVQMTANEAKVTAMQTLLPRVQMHFKSSCSSQMHQIRAFHSEKAPYCAHASEYFCAFSIRIGER